MATVFDLPTLFSFPRPLITISLMLILALVGALLTKRAAETRLDLVSWSVAINIGLGMLFLAVWGQDHWVDIILDASLTVITLLLVDGFRQGVAGAVLLEIPRSVGQRINRIARSPGRDALIMRTVLGGCALLSLSAVPDGATRPAQAAAAVVVMYGLRWPLRWLLLDFAGRWRERKMPDAVRAVFVRMTADPGNLRSRAAGIGYRKWMLPIVRDGVVRCQRDLDFSGNGLRRLPVRIGTVKGLLDLSGNRLEFVDSTTGPVGALDVSGNLVDELDVSAEIIDARRCPRLRQIGKCGGALVTADWEAVNNNRILHERAQLNMAASNGRTNGRRAL